MTDVKRYHAGKESMFTFTSEEQAGLAFKKMEDNLKALQAENKRLTKKTLDQFIEIQDLRRVANDLKGESEKLKLQKTEIMKGVSEFQQMEVVAENKLKADAVREYGEHLRQMAIMRTVPNTPEEFANKLEAGE